MATEYDHENGRYDDEPRFARDRSASPRDEPRGDRTRSRSPNGRVDDRPPVDTRKPPIDDDEEGALNTGSNLFVTGIHPRLTESDISRLFEKYGDVENCSIMVDPHTKESRGFGFVKMVTAEQADAAKEGLQGEVIEGRTLSIEKARRSRPRTPTPGKYFGPPKREDFRGGHRGRGDRYDDRRGGGYGGNWRRGGDDYRYGRYDSYSDRRDYGGGRDYRDYGRRDYRDDYGYRGGGGGGGGGIDRYASGGGREDRYNRDERRGGGGGGGEERRAGGGGGGEERRGYYDRDANAASYGSAPPAREPYAGGGGSGGGSGRSYEPRGDDRYSTR
ncbi:RNA recognition motif domain-containing protein [Aspergillus homomorphus CBS 101889]|uniref:RNA-binding domain-containing protein n=1 Tax=Aspergillus homomorphus (strain CBS 101889) TaxID=1450537 RepID=A0A395HXY6_ASPHC|nr:RNA-binding domain-containing protein [Aspergillus homomorphus CBS 101889]RAL12792.1 RNA-binding domain-containing protein [Aspergillus homomorphus CBS 101889]